LVADDGRAVDLRDSRGFWKAAPGAGAIDHVAFRAETLEALRDVGRGFATDGLEISEIRDRRYFRILHAIYRNDARIDLLD
ncbi:MAG: hypothetical protein ACF8CQ_03505, partial [Rhodopirellula sp. JB044]|uniref:hypothetical protein n=1 Tax=Rhodopirellula sp. JB044 TaxID=3342844 RepID=UPI00370BACD3